MKKEELEQKRLKEEEARAKAERERLWALQVGYKKELETLNDGSLRAFENLTESLQNAEKHLDRAERDFTEGALAPFWESIEHAAKSLANVNERVRQIEQNSLRYAEVAKKCDSRPAGFSISVTAVTKLGVAPMTSKRMGAIVRKAQTNFQFSMIYEQRKTNQILVAGFQSLAQALDQMTGRITSAIYDLKESVDDLAEAVDNSLGNIYKMSARGALAAENMATQVAASSENMVVQFEASSERERLAIEMLDNIQRKRYPGIVHGGLR